jgi:lipoate-protein ligase A
MLRVLDTGISEAEENMRMDQDFLETLDSKGEPILHLYGWKGNVATIGFFIQPEKHFNFSALEKWNLSLAKRPTGGGIVFHIWDLAFSFLMPSHHSCFSISKLDNYRFVNEAVLETMKEFFVLKGDVELTNVNFLSKIPECQNFCMAKPTQYDVVYRGQKIAGASQRRKKQGYLHQGTISLAFPDMDLLRETLLVPDEVFQAMSAYTFAPLGQNVDFKTLQEARLEIQKRLTVKLIEKLSLPVYNVAHGQTENSNHSNSI